MEGKPEAAGEAAKVRNVAPCTNGVAVQTVIKGKKAGMV